jgi:hypothetical protein
MAVQNGEFRIVAGSRDLSTGRGCRARGRQHDRVLQGSVAKAVTVPAYPRESERLTSSSFKKRRSACRFGDNRCRGPQLVPGVVKDFEY